VIVHHVWIAFVGTSVTFVLFELGVWIRAHRKRVALETLSKYPKVDKPIFDK
jgi:hypothetical protein